MESSTSNLESVNRVLLHGHKDEPKLWLLVMSGSSILHLILGGLFYWLLINKRPRIQVISEQIPIEIVAITTTQKNPQPSNSLPKATEEKSSSPRPTPSSESEPVNVTRFSNLRPTSPRNITPPNQQNYRLSSQIKSSSPSTPAPSSSITRFSDIPRNNFPNQGNKSQESETLNNSSSVRRFSDVQGKNLSTQEELISRSPSQLSTPTPIPKTPPASSSVRRFSDLQGENPPTQEKVRDFNENNNISSQENIGGGLIATIIGTPQITNTEKDIPDQYAQPKQNEIRLPSTDYLNNSDVKINQTLRLRIMVLIDDQGKAEIIPNETQVLVGSINLKSAEKLSQKIISSWNFEPTYMAGGAVFQAYYLTLEITPF